MKLYITSDNSKMEIEMSSTSTIRDLKTRIRGTTKIPNDMQRFIFRALFLEEDQAPLSRYNIKDGDKLKLIVSSKNNIEIYIQAASEEQRTITVKKSDTVEELKTIIMEETSIHPDAQRLVYEDELLDVDYRSLEQCNIREGSVITVLNILDTPAACNPMRITVADYSKLNRTEVNRYNVLTNDGILSFKKKLQETSGLPVEHQSLSRHGGGDLIDTLRFCDYEIKDGATLTLHKHFHLKYELKD